MKEIVMSEDKPCPLCGIPMNAVVGLLTGRLIVVDAKAIDEERTRTNSLLVAAKALADTMPLCVEPYGMPPNARPIIELRTAIAAHPRGGA